MSYYLGVDVRRTSSRWAVVDVENRLVSRGQGPGASGLLFVPEHQERFRAMLQAISFQCNLQSVCAFRIGATGLSGPAYPNATALCTDIFQTDHIVVSDDLELAYLTIFARDEGHVVSAGTGSMGLHIKNDGSQVRVGGRGILIDDCGSGTSIALRALKTLSARHLRQSEHVPEPHLMERPTQIARRHRRSPAPRHALHKEPMVAGANRGTSADRILTNALCVL